MQIGTCSGRAAARLRPRSKAVIRVKTAGPNTAVPAVTRRARCAIETPAWICSMIYDFSLASRHWVEDSRSGLHQP